MTAATLAGYRRRAAQRFAALGAVTTAVLLAFVLDIATGPSRLAIDDVAASLTGRVIDPITDAIVWSLRLPMALMAVVVGFALGISGAVMQTVLNNPLASPYTLGISAAAGLGAALVIVLGASLPVEANLAIPLNAFLFAGLACGAVYMIGRAAGMTPETMVLAGIAVLFFFPSVAIASAVLGDAGGAAGYRLLVIRQPSEGHLVQCPCGCSCASAGFSNPAVRCLAPDCVEAW